MSYSVCLQCETMVGGYEKYCQKCAKTKKENDPLFWKTHGYDYFDEPKRSQELRKEGVEQNEMPH